MPYEKPRNNGECEVGDDAEDAVGVCEANDKIVANTCSRGIPSCPEVIDWVALENDHEEKGASSDNRNQHRTIENPRVDASDAYPKEKDSD